MTERVFHVELSIRKWVEVRIADAETYEGDELSEEIETLALESFWNSERTWGDEYEYETVKEIASEPTP